MNMKLQCVLVKQPWPDYKPGISQGNSLLAYMSSYMLV